MKGSKVWVLVVLFWTLWVGTVQAVGLGDSPLSRRLSEFPEWQSKPTVPSANGDLVYPEWFAGEWRVTTTLTDMVAPMPDLTTPGFEGNRQYLQQPVEFAVRFVEARSLYSTRNPLALIPTVWSAKTPQIVSDRAFNGMSLAKAYLGDRAVVSVKVDPTNPNRQITQLQSNRQLVSTIVARATETPSADKFLTTEMFVQEFRGSPQLYFNEVETTTAYQRLADGAIAADQVTAIYLSPQDPDFFKAGERPVALYRYRMEFSAL